MLRFKSWQDLTPARRGWAIGGIFGLLATCAYLDGVTLYATPGWRLTYSLLTLPALPGFSAANALIFPQEDPIDLFRPLFIEGNLLYIGLVAASNYVFWGCIISLLFQTLPRPKKFSLADTFLGFFCLFCAVTGISYTVNCGLVMRPYLFDIVILFGAIVLAIVSLGFLLACATAESP